MLLVGRRDLDVSSEVPVLQWFVKGKLGFATSSDSSNDGPFLCLSVVKICGRYDDLLIFDPVDGLLESDLRRSHVSSARQLGPGLGSGLTVDVQSTVSDKDTLVTVDR